MLHPLADELAAVPHHLFSVLDPTETMDAQRYRNMAQECVNQVAQAGKRPIIVGGSGMYLKFLTHGPSPVPAGDPQLRKALEKQNYGGVGCTAYPMRPRGRSNHQFKIVAT